MAALLLVMASATAAQGVAPPADYVPYDPDLIDIHFRFDKVRYLVGEPIYWEVEFANRYNPIVEIGMIPSYQDDVRLEIVLPNGLTTLYRGTDLPGFKPMQSHRILRGERRHFNFRIYYDGDRTLADPTRLFFPEPTRALVIPAVRFRANRRDMVYEPGINFPIEIVAPIGRDAQCLKLISTPEMVAIIHERFAKPENWPKIENILHLYSDTVYAPHLALVLANSYFREATRKNTLDERMMRQAIAAFTVLLQVEDVSYIQEYSLFMIALCYWYMDNDRAFVGWYRKYLETYGEYARFAFAGSKIQQAYEELRDPDRGQLWHLYP